MSAPPQSPPSSAQSPQITPHGSFSQLSNHHRSTSFGPISESNKAISSGYPGYGGRDSRDARVSSVKQSNSRFLLGSYSGQTGLDVALAVGDAHRREAFSTHSLKVWNEHIKDVPKAKQNIIKKRTTSSISGHQAPDNVSKVISSILEIDNYIDGIPIPCTQEDELTYRQRFRSRRNTESESDNEGAMFRDDSNSFIVDCLSEPVLTILNSKGLALHEALDEQADCFENLSSKRRDRMFHAFGDVLVKADWMFDSEKDAAQKCEVTSNNVSKYIVHSDKPGKTSKSELARLDDGDAPDVSPFPSLRRIKSEARDQLPKLSTITT